MTMTWRKVVCVLAAGALCTGLAMAQVKTAPAVTAHNPAVTQSHSASAISPAQTTPSSIKAPVPAKELGAPLPPNQGGLRQGGDTCETAVAITLPYSDSGTTVGRTSTHPFTCAANSGPQVWYSFAATADGSINASLCGSSYDTALAIFSGSCSGLTQLACNDDFCGLQSEIDNFPISNGTTYYIVVSGFSTASGSYTLNVGLNITGACCMPDGSCNASTATACATAGGTYQGDNTLCENVQCPITCPPPPNDDCANVTPVDLVPGNPVTFTGDNTCATLGTDCTAFGSFPNVWIAFNVPETMDVTLDYCTTTPAFGDAWLNLAQQCSQSCSFTAAGAYDFTTCGDGNVTIRWSGVPAGTYYYPVMKDVPNNAVGAYTIHVVGVIQQPCAEPPPGSTPENEPCMTDTNGGCNSSPNIFGAMSCGETISGTSWFDGSTRDTDWFEVYNDSGQTMTLTVETEFAALIGFVGQTVPGLQGCANMTGSISPYALPARCTPATVQMSVPAGYYYVFVAPQFVGTVSCDAGNRWVATLTCEPFQVMTGACCACDGSCQILTQEQCTAAGGTYQGDNTTCTEGLCPNQSPVNDTCTNVTPVVLTPGLPQVFNGTTHCATNDCSLTAPYGEVWEAFTINATADVTIELCGTTPAPQRAFIVVIPDCSCTSDIFATSYGWTCPDGNFHSLYAALPAGTYYYPVIYSPVDQADGPYTLTVTQAAPLGACCVGTDCSILSQAACTAAGGRYIGDNTTCGGGSWVYTNSNGAWEDISGTGTEITAAEVDDGGAAVPIGFTFTFYGSAKTSVGVCSNGYMTFGTTYGDYTPDAIPNTNTPNDLIAVVWRDLNASGLARSVVYQTLGSAPNRRFIAQWTGVPCYGGACGGNTFQAVLYEGSNNIELRYQDVPAPSAKAGFENADGTIGTDATPYLASFSSGLFNFAVLENPCQVQVCRGDMNCDGVVDFEDINAFVAILGGATPCSRDNADVNGDGSINFSDINPFVDLLTGGGGPCR